MYIIGTMNRELKIFLVEKGITSKWLAEYLGVHWRTIGNYKKDGYIVEEKDDHYKIVEPENKQLRILKEDL